MPWLATGHPGERADRDALDNPETADHARQVREEAAAVAADNEARGVPSAEVLDRVMASVERETARAPRLRRMTWAAAIERWLDSLRAPAVGRLAAVGAAVLVIAVQAAVIGYLIAERPASTYQTASGQDMAARMGPGFLARFESEATATEISATLRAAGVRIVDGPKAGGFYRVSLTAPDKQNIDDVEQVLRASSVVTTLLPASDRE
ncbi:MAG: hypothetical protein ACLFPA_08925 [Dichotomicrobium sp.]